MTSKNILFPAILIILGILFRTIWHLGPNIEFVTAAVLLSASYLGKKWTIMVPFLIMIISDLIIGNTNIFIFTWSGFIFIGYLSTLSKLSSLRFGPRVLRATGLGILGSFLFYIWTNFGVWLLDSWGMYPKTISGLFKAYILALPFLKYNLIGNLFIVPLSFVIVEKLKLFGLDLGFQINKRRAGSHV